MEDINNINEPAISEISFSATCFAQSAVETGASASPQDAQESPRLSRSLSSGVSELACTFGGFLKRTGATPLGR